MSPKTTPSAPNVSARRAVRLVGDPPRREGPWTSGGGPGSGGAGGLVAGVSAIDLGGLYPSVPPVRYGRASRGADVPRPARRMTPQRSVTLTISPAPGGAPKPLLETYRAPSGPSVMAVGVLSPERTTWRSPLGPTRTMSPAPGPGKPA